MAPDLPSKERVNKAGKLLCAYIESRKDLTDEELQAEIAICEAWRKQHIYPIRLTMPALRKMGRSVLHRRKSRLLSGLSERHPGMKLARMQDIGGARAVQIANVTDWRDSGRPDTGYRALHVMVWKRDRISDEDRQVEVQLRTTSQQRWAEVVTETADIHGLSLSDGDGPPELVEYFRRSSDLLAAREGQFELPRGFADRFRELREKVRPFFQRT